MSLCECHTSRMAARNTRPPRFAVPAEPEATYLRTWPSEPGHRGWQAAAPEPQADTPFTGAAALDMGEDTDDDVGSGFDGSVRPQTRCWRLPMRGGGNCLCHATRDRQNIWSGAPWLRWLQNGGQSTSDGDLSPSSGRAEAPLWWKANGGGDLALSFKEQGVRVKVTGAIGYTFGTGASEWTVRYSVGLEHYDVVDGWKLDRPGTGQVPKGKHTEAIEKADTAPTTVRSSGNPMLASGTGKRRGNLVAGTNMEP